MTITTTDPQLTATRAREIVSHAVDFARRAGVERFELAASRPIEGFAREYDTLAVEVKPQPSHLRHLLQPEQQRHRSAASGASLLRETLLLLHAVSSCRGFSFRENPSFWKDALSLELSPAVPITSQRLPRVYLDWNPEDVVSLPEYDKAVSQRLLETSVLDLFTTRAPLPLSQRGQALLEDARTWVRNRGRDCHGIECVVVLRFARAADATKALVSSVISAAKNAASNPLNDTLVWVGVRLVSSDHVRYVNHGLLTTANLAIVAHLCVVLPPALSVDLRLPRSQTERCTPLTPSVKRAFASFMAPAIGMRDTKWLGRMTVLDLMFRIQYLDTCVAAVDFASLCSLLPLARSLRKLRVAITSTSDLVWLVYAAMHPLSGTSKWRTLHVDDQYYGSRIDWQQVQRLGTSPSLFATLWSLLTEPTTPVTVTPEARNETSYGLMWRTTTIASEAAVFSPDKSSTLAQLGVGQRVELCDTTTAIDELTVQHGHSDLDDVAVVVAGVGLGWIHKRHLSTISDTRFDGRPRSSLTTLTLGKYLKVVRDLDTVLAIFGPPLQHLRLRTYEPFAIRDVARMCPLLESLEIPRMRSHPDDDVGDDGATVGTLLPRLRHVGVACDVQSLDTCFRILHSLSSLRTLRLIFRPSESPRAWDLVRQHIKALIAAKNPTLWWVALISPYQRPERAAPQETAVVDRDCSGSVKRALLSVIRAATTQRDHTGTTTALASLGADVLPLVFEFARPNVTTADVVDDALWPTDWYDMNRNYHYS